MGPLCHTCKLSPRRANTTRACTTCTLACAPAALSSHRPQAATGRRLPWVAELSGSWAQADSGCRPAASCHPGAHRLLHPRLCHALRRGQTDCRVQRKTQGQVHVDAEAPTPRTCRLGEDPNAGRGSGRWNLLGEGCDMWDPCRARRRERTGTSAPRRPPGDAAPHRSSVHHTALHRRRRMIYVNGGRSPAPPPMPLQPRSHAALRRASPPAGAVCPGCRKRAAWTGRSPTPHPPVALGS